MHWHVFDMYLIEMLQHSVNYNKATTKPLPNSLHDSIDLFQRNEITSEYFYITLWIKTSF